jgi:putative oxidoreductase
LTSSFQDDLAQSLHRYGLLHYPSSCRTHVRLSRRQKILGFPPSERGLAINPLGLTAGWIELSCGFLVASGLLTRLAAFIASGEMAVAYFLTSFSGKTLNHAPSVLDRLLPILNKGELPVLFCFMFLLVMFYGPGRWSIDSLLKGKLRSAATSSSS